MANRGMADALIACCDGLKGLPEAVEATWPKAIVQTCVVHLIRAANRFVADHDRKRVCAALRSVYCALNGQAAQKALGEFAESELGRRYPSVAATWKRSWDRFVPFLQFPPMLRRVVYTTNSIESLNYQLRKVSRNRSPVPQRPGRGQAVLAGNLRHRGQNAASKRAQKTGNKNQAQKAREGSARDAYDQLETGPRPTRGRIPRTNGTLFIKHTPNTNNLTSSHTKEDE